MTDKEIEKLEYILDRLIDYKSHVSSNDLHRDGLYDEYNDDKEKIEEDFSLLQSYAFKYGFAEKLSTQDGHLILYNLETLVFKKKHGSFKSYYNKIVEQNKLSELELEKDKERQGLKDEIDRLTIVNLELQNKQMKRYVIYSIISFILGGLLTNVKDILQLLNLQ